MVTAYKERVAFIRRTAATLPHRVRIAMALAAADRCFELAADGIGSAPVEMAVELARVFAQGELVSPDEASWGWRGVDDAEIAKKHELSGPEDFAVRVVWYMADALRSPAKSEEAAAEALEALMDTAHQVTDDEGWDEEYVWVERVLNVASQGDAPFAKLSNVGAEAPPRWLVRALARIDRDENDPDDLKAQATALMAARRTAMAARADRVAELRRARPVPPYRERHGIPATLSVEHVDDASVSREGKIAVSGQAYYGVFEANSEPDAEALFVPPQSVAIGMTSDEKTLASWRVAPLAGVSGIARGHYRWTLELYAWPGGALIASHVVQSQEMIDWFSPGWIEVPPSDDGAVVVVLRAFNEDGRCDLTITRRADGTFHERV